MALKSQVLEVPLLQVQPKVSVWAEAQPWPVWPQVEVELQEPGQPILPV